MPNQLPSGSWRGRVWHARQQKQVSTRTVIGGPDSYDTRAEAVAAEDDARRALASSRGGVTLAEWHEEWTSDPLWKRPAASTNIHYAERTRKFVQRFGDVAIRAVGDDHVSEWLRGGQNRETVKELRVMFNDAASAPAGRLVKANPFSNLRLPSTRGRKDVQPPDEAAVERLIAIADELTPPTFAGYLEVAIAEGMRPGELDALRRSKLDFQAEEIMVDEQWNVKTKTFTRPKHHHVRRIAMTERAKTRLLSLPVESEWAFTTLRGSHYRPTTRVHHWNRVRAAAGLGNVDLYTVTRHYFGWYAYNVLELSDVVIALHLGHRDGGKLVRTLYGHPDEAIARDKVREAHRSAPTAPIPLRVAS